MDASNFALAAIISIYYKGELHPITFHLWIFQSAKLNYNIHDKKLLAIFEAFKR